MKKLLTYLFTIVGTAIVLYAGFFMVWVMLVAACMQNADINGTAWQSCGDNTMTVLVQKAYSPIIQAYEQ